MTLITALPVLVAIAGAAYVAGVYNQIVKAGVKIEKAWANITVLEKQRYEEIPRLVQICSDYMKYERGTLEKVIQARAQYLEARTPSATAQADASLLLGLNKLFAVAENYPELKAHENFAKLQRRISDLECQIADRREFFNDAVAIFNTRIQQVPHSLLAALMGYQPQEMYRVDEEERQNAQVDLR